MTVMYRTNSYSFSIHKLQWPYSDKCIHYDKFGYDDRFDAIANCEEKINPMLSLFRRAWKKMYRYSNYSTGPSRCDEKQFKVDCFQRLYLTQVGIPEIIGKYP